MEENQKSKKTHNQKKNLEVRDDCENEETVDLKAKGNQMEQCEK